MKVYSLNPATPDAYLEIKSVNFYSHRREEFRKHIQAERGTHLVWFEDEDPPNEVIESIQEAHMRAEAERLKQAMKDYHDILGNQNPGGADPEGGEGTQ